MVSIKIYVEGGGDRKDLKTRCRQGFSQFFEKAGFKGRMPAVVACGSRQKAYDNFCTAVKTADDNELPMLLVDSEDAVSESPWLHLHSRDGWLCPDGAQDKQAHLMVQVMESWFLVDRLTLGDHFGKGFREAALPNRTKIEEVAKQEVFDSLKSATRDCGKDKVYDEKAKGKHSFDILGKLDPGKVRKASPHAERLLQAIDNPNT